MIDDNFGLCLPFRIWAWQQESVWQHSQIWKNWCQLKMVRTNVRRIKKSPQTTSSQIQTSSHQSMAWIDNTPQWNSPSLVESKVSSSENTLHQKRNPWDSQGGYVTLRLEPWREHLNMNSHQKTRPNNLCIGYGMWGVQIVELMGVSLKRKQLAQKRCDLMTLRLLDDRSINNTPLLHNNNRYVKQRDRSNHLYPSPSTLQVVKTAHKTFGDSVWRFFFVWGITRLWKHATVEFIGPDAGSEDEEWGDWLKYHAFQTKIWEIEVLKHHSVLGAQYSLSNGVHIVFLVYSINQCKSLEAWAHYWLMEKD